MHARGQGMDRDYDKARAYYERAATMDQPYALNALGFMHGSGKSVPVNPKQPMNFTPSQRH